ncbi:MAG: TolC family protein [Flavobacteriaceae bacterium]|nr:TolC family protein [Flavobacteriaceae bacterium]
MCLDKNNKYSLDQLLDNALQNNYLLKSTEKNKLVKQSELEIIKTNYLPKISASFNKFFLLEISIT